jgi:ATP-binding cassette, subfamily B, bacterial
MKKIEANPIKNALESLSECFWHCFIFSFVINALSLALPIYSMQVLDRVLGSSSIETLIYLSLIIFLSVCAMNFLTNVRDSAFTFIGDNFEKKLSLTIFSKNIKDCVGSNIGSQYLRDLSNIKSFITGSNLALIFDVPWVLIFLAVIFYIHWVLGFVILGFALILATLAFFNQKILKTDSERLSDVQVLMSRKLDILTRNAEVIVGMGMIENLSKKREHDLSEQKSLEVALKKKSKTISTITKTLRYGMQIAITFISAILIIKGKMSSGGMIAISILSSKVLVPFDASPTVFQALVALKKAYERLKNSLKDISTTPRTKLPEPLGNIICEGLFFNSGQVRIINGISFKANAGEVIGVVGKSGSGKTTLARLLSGIFEPSRGKILLDSSPLNLWDESQIGNYIGYLPQDVELLHATIKENISRFNFDAKDEDVVAAAIKAGVHELIMSFPQGYETMVGMTNISAGQKQRIALARAFYGNPKVLILDEPNSNLDIEGENALLGAVSAAKQNKITVFLISHKPSILKVTDKIVILHDGEVKGFDVSQKIIDSFSTKS